MSKAAWVLAVATTCMLAVASPAPCQESVALSAKSPTVISTIPEYVQAGGRAEVANSNQPGSLRVTLSSKPTILPGRGMCLCCVEVVEVAPNVKLPLNPLFSIISQEGLEKLTGNKVTTQISMEGVLTYVLTISGGKTWGNDNLDAYIVAGASGATLKKEGRGLLLVKGDANLVKKEATSGTTEATSPANPVEIRLTSSNVKSPDGITAALRLEVLKGKYKLASGTTLWTGSKVYVQQDRLTFPAGLVVRIGLGGATLRGHSYAEDAKLRVDEKGALRVIK